MIVNGLFFAGRGPLSLPTPPCLPKDVIGIDALLQ
jgi:hypothetical protein